MAKNWVVFFALALGSVGVLLHAPVSDVYIPTKTLTMKTPHSTTTSSLGDQEHFKCAASLSNEISELPPVFIFMPAKAGGTAIKWFARKCHDNSDGRTDPQTIENFVNRQGKYINYLLDNLQVPKITASHLYSPIPLLNAVRHASQGSIFIYVYRKETDRLMSSIRQVANTLGTNDAETFRNNFKSPIESRKDDFGLDISITADNTRMIALNEDAFVTKVIEPRRAEIGFSVPSQLTCDVWNELQETGPDRFFFVHYSALDQVQDALASRYCPKVTSVRHNVAAKKSDRVMLRMLNQSLIELDDWIEAKKDHIEFALQMSGERVSGTGSGSCKHQTRVMQHELSRCDSGILQWLPR
uniref:Sulfotransferase domain-containing protein n=1 Tax=Amphora coffeiformis TaxID=265554 RepID=A0A7S3L0R8_9STRA|eukprot:scaffold4232_cov215-Amphora_coffeaeformis.AAC.13